MYKCAPKGAVCPTAILPSSDQPCQMSPFSDDRWVIDHEENVKRREIHRNLVYNVNRNQYAPEEVRRRPEEFHTPRQPSVYTVNPQTLEPAPEFKMEVGEKDPFKIEPSPQYKPKSLSEICFESPPPPNLFPKLKFTEPGIIREEYHRPASAYLKPIYSRLPEKHEECPKKTQFHDFKEVKVDRAVHYGVTVPFWQFK